MFASVADSLWMIHSCIPEQQGQTGREHKIIKPSFREISCVVPCLKTEEGRKGKNVQGWKCTANNSCQEGRWKPYNKYIEQNFINIFLACYKLKSISQLPSRCRHTLWGCGVWHSRAIFGPLLLPLRQVSALVVNKLWTIRFHDKGPDVWLRCGWCLVNGGLIGPIDHFLKHCRF